MISPRLIFHFILIILVSLLQLSLVQTLPGWWGYFNLALVVLIFVLALSGFPKALIWAVGMGFIFDVYNFFPFGFFMISFLIAVVSANFLLNSFFTDRSLFSYLALTLIVTFVYEVVFYSGGHIVNWYWQDIPFFLTVSEFWIKFFRQTVLNFGAVIVLFYFFNFVSDRLSAVFLKR